jgi:hypothetical protein
MVGCGARSVLSMGTPGEASEGGMLDGSSPRDESGLLDGGDSGARRDAPSVDAGELEADSVCPDPGTEISGTALWVDEFKTSPETSHVINVSGVSLDSSGDMLVAGGFGGQVSVGGATLTSTVDPIDNPAGEPFVVKFDGAGNVVFAEKFSGTCSSTSCYPLEDTAFAAVFDADGNLYVTGVYQGTLTFPGTPPGVVTTHYPVKGTDFGPSAAFLVKLDSTGQHLWSKSFGGTAGDAEGIRVSVDTEGSLLLGGTASGRVAFSGAGDAGSATAAELGPFVVKFSSAGDYLWSRSFSSPMFADLRDQTLDAAGNLYVAGSFDTSLTFQKPEVDAGGVDGGTTVEGSCDTPGYPGECTQTAFAAKIAPDGSLLWSRALVDHGFSATNGVTVDGAGHPAVVGWAFDTMADDGGPPSERADHNFVSRLDPETGIAQWSIVAGRGAAGSGSIAGDAVGNLFVVAQASGAVTFSDGYDAGGSPGDDTFLARLAPDGGTTWARAYGGGYFVTMAMERCATEIIVAGNLDGTMTLQTADGGALEFDGTNDLVLGRFAR